jgi:hypothetical protein
MRRAQTVPAIVPYACHDSAKPCPGGRELADQTLNNEQPPRDDPLRIPVEMLPVHPVWLTHVQALFADQ